MIRFDPAISALNNATCNAYRHSGFLHSLVRMHWETQIIFYIRTRLHWYWEARQITFSIRIGNRTIHKYQNGAATTAGHVNKLDSGSLTLLLIICSLYYLYCNVYYLIAE